MKQCRCKSSYLSNSFAKKGLKVTFCFEKKIIHDKSVIRNDNKQKLKLIIELYGVIFAKMNILS